MKGYIKLWLIICLLASCRQHRVENKTDRGFYYWKSVMGLSHAERLALDRLAVNKLYIKCFDVVWDASHQQPVPVAKILFTDSADTWLSNRHTAIIPTLFITNECMLLLDSTKIASLSNDIHNLLSATVANHFPAQNISEIQIDCDWTAASRDKYFALLRHLQLQPFFRNRVVSATIRLYQCKYKLKTGVPPVKKGLLMCYNMGNLKSAASSNSIIEAAELEKYISNLQEYPLPLDIALPIFEWKVLFHEGAYKGLIRDLPDSLLLQKGVATQSNNTWHILQDTMVNGYSFQKGDVVRKEDATFDEVMKVTRLLLPKLTTSRFSVVLYHLDSLTLLKYSTDELEKMFNSLH